MRSLKILLSLLFIFLFAELGNAQTFEHQLANQYLNNNEFEKAAVVFEKLLAKESKDLKSYQSLLKCYIVLKQYEDALKLSTKYAKKNDQFPQFVIDMGYAYELNRDTAKANKIFEKAVDNLVANQSQIQMLADAFDQYGKTRWIANTYQRGAKLLKDDNIFLVPLANAYMSLGEYKLAITAYINHLEKSPFNVQVVKNTFQPHLENKKVSAALEDQIYTKLQKQPDADHWNDLAVWIAVQQRDFENALIQVKAIDKRKGEKGHRVLEIARLARREKSYSDALSGYEYILSKGKGKTELYPLVENEILSTRKEKIEQYANWSDSDAVALKRDYERFFADYGKNGNTAKLIIEYAEVLANYLYQMDSAITELEQLVLMGNIDQKVKNRAKLQLGDFYVMIDEVWEALLLYGQVDKDEKDSPLGEEARFKHARMFYFKGDFQLSRELLDVLKSATSELIANDALLLSVFIIDNLGTDSVSIPMDKFAASELLIMQNRLDEAQRTLDTIYDLYKGHTLTDDIYFAHAKIWIKKRNFPKAIESLDMVLKNYKFDILGDDAMFLIAQIYEELLKDNEKAKQYYKDVLTTYKDSVYIVEARKRFRKLRGDKYEEEL
ncbi:MAG: tetratricopeptide repeat protein [Bacteroidetes bacterium]|nr:tetratricopeptide repeat protein [Bacteroidota bacterium]